MNEWVVLLIRVALAVVGISYLLTVLRRRRGASNGLASATRTPRIATLGSNKQSTARDPRVLAARWESVRTWSTRIAVGCFVLLAILLALAAPLSFIEFVLIAIGVSMTVYLISSMASGWYEGKSQL